MMGVSVALPEIAVLADDRMMLSEPVRICKAPGQVYSFY